MKRIQHLVRAICQGYGTAAMKKALWNSEFASGKWDCLDKSPNDCVYAFVEKYARGGTILDLGCGVGNTANELASSAYSTYTGVDIADVAVKKAIGRSKANRKENRHSFIQSEFSLFIPDQAYNVILFRDSIYYTPLGRVPTMLTRYTAYLKNDGVFIVRVWGGHKALLIVDVIVKTFDIVEYYEQDNPSAIVIVFR